jgi:hypothetical protein
MTMSMTVSILGTEYKIFYRTPKEDKVLEENDGYCDFSSKEIVISLDEGNLHDHERYRRKVLRHEIVHAFMYESGLDVNAFVSNRSWAVNEEMIDWIAIQGEKIHKAWSEVNCLD